MADLYANYGQLAAAEVEGVDYTRTVSGTPRAVWSMIAIHGGGIEAGSGELAQAAAGTQAGCYVFAGIKSTGNTNLHVTSTNFDEPYGLALVAGTQKTLSMHGFTGTGGVKQTAIGGGDTATIALLTARLTAAGFTVIAPAVEIDGDDPDNICNKNRAGAGVQLELSLEQRQAFFPGGSTSRPVRESGARTAEFWQYVTVLRTVLPTGNALAYTATINWGGA